MYFQKELKSLIKSSSSLIYVMTLEEERLEYIIKSVVSDDMAQAIYFWDFLEGYCVKNSQNDKSIKNPLEALSFIESFNGQSDALFVLKDFNLFINDFAVIRKIRNLSRKLECCNHVVIITGIDYNMPAQLNHLITAITLPLPSKLEIKGELCRLLSLLSQPYHEEELGPISNLLQGLSIIQIRKIVAKILVNSHRLSPNSIEAIVKEKEMQVKQTSLLEFCSSDVALCDIGGIDNLKTWLQKRSNSFSEASQNYGLVYPKGVLLVGIQGTGKSISAKAIAREWSLVLLRLDVGKLFAGLVGESESNTRQMIQIVEASAPCVLWIDEIDKAFSSITQGGDSGTGSRVLATLLTWLSEKTSPVFVVATANSIASLPAEIIRKGRFDEIFFLDLPSLYERQIIFQVHLKKIRPDTWHRYNIKYLAKYTHLFSGAEIQQVIVEAMHGAFYENREFGSIDILNAIDSLVPLAFTDQDNVQKLQEWASLGRVRLA
uniref:Uncharacterized AAA domain-containing protein ycf46 n=1 Tax=Scinaia undulata TaxID=1884664 RepID=A0A1G4NXA5_9FLOR|nr:Hypothetical protein ycf46 [Scinaia undulata]SCW23321.1 Hypothetical protein ycf46 [Scinaia undulata]